MPPKGSKLVRAHYRKAAGAKHAGKATSTIKVRKTITVERTTISSKKKAKK